MTDRKTAAELRRTAGHFTAGGDLEVICLHLAAVEEERERAESPDVTGATSHDLRAEVDRLAKVIHDVHTALGARHFDELLLDAARRVVAERDAAIARAEASESALAQCERDLREEIARAEAAEKRVAELEDRLAVPGADLVKRLSDERDHYRERSLGFEKALAGQYARGIREGLERAAVVCDREAEACRGHQRALEKEPRAGKVPSSAMHECAANQNAACAHYIRAMKAEVK